MYLGVRDKKLLIIGQKRRRQILASLTREKNRLLLPGFVNAHSHLPMRFYAVTARI